MTIFYFYFFEHTNTDVVLLLKRRVRHIYTLGLVCSFRDFSLYATGANFFIHAFFIIAGVVLGVPASTYIEV